MLIWYIAVICTLNFITLVAISVLLVKMVDDAQQEETINRESGLMDVTLTRTYEDEMLAEIPENYGDPRREDRV